MVVNGHRVEACTPMGPAVPGSKLARLAEGQKLVDKLIVDGWRAGYLAEELEVGRGTLRAWRLGRRAPTQEQLLRMRDIVRLDDQTAAASRRGEAGAKERARQSASP